MIFFVHFKIKFYFCDSKVPEQMKYDVFISYSRKDLEFAKRVCAAFDAYKEHYEFEYFFDMDEIKGRHEYLKRISAAISKSKVMLFLASVNSTKSEFCTKELLFADKHKVFIHQYRIDETELPEDIDLLLGNHHYREASNFSIEDIVCEVLSDALKQDVRPISQLIVSNKQQSTALVRIESDTKCRVLRFGKELAVVDKGISELHLPKGKQKLSFVSVENGADRFDYLLDICDLEYEEYIEVKLLNKCETYELDKSCNSSDNCSQESRENAGVLNSVVDVALALNPVAAGAVALYKAYKALKNDSTNAKTYKVGDYYDDGKKQGVVFEVTPDGKHGKIVSLTESSKELLWSSDSEERKRFIGADDKMNGANNMAKIKSIAGWREKYPAFAWCADLGEGWYLPAIEELKKFTLDDDVHDAVNRTLAAKGEELANKGALRWYWSSTEDDEFCAWSVLMSCGNTRSYHKYYNGYVRAVSAF